MSKWLRQDWFVIGQIVNPCLGSWWNAMYEFYDGMNKLSIISWNISHLKKSTQFKVDVQIEGHHLTRNVLFVIHGWVRFQQWFVNLFYIHIYSSLFTIIKRRDIWFVEIDYKYLWLCDCKAYYFLYWQFFDH